MAKNELSPEQAAQRVRAALERIAEQLPAVANVVEAFTDLLVERTRFREALPIHGKPPVKEIDPDRFRQGVPLADKVAFMVSAEDLKSAAGSLIPAMEKGFPAIGPALGAIAQGIKDGWFPLETFARSFLEDRPEDIGEMAAELKIDAGIVTLLIGQLIKPFAERRVQSITPLAPELHWFKGYCPICGSWPMVSSLRGKEGRRWLTCSFCGHEWPYIRIACPFCENDNHETLEHFYSEDRPSETAEVCRQCKRYIVGIDLRDRENEVLMETASLGLVYLDILAQQKGFTAGAVTPWNVIDKELSELETLHQKHRRPEEQN